MTSRKSNVLKLISCGLVSVALATGTTGCKEEPPPTPPAPTPPPPPPPPPPEVVWDETISELDVDPRISVASNIYSEDQDAAEAVLTFADALASGNDVAFRQMLSSSARRDFEKVLDTGGWDEAAFEIQGVRLVYMGPYNAALASYSEQFDPNDIEPEQLEDEANFNSLAKLYAGNFDRLLEMFGGSVEGLEEGQKYTDYLKENADRIPDELKDMFTEIGDASSMSFDDAVAFMQRYSDFVTSSPQIEGGEQEKELIELYIQIARMLPPEQGRGFLIVIIKLSQSIYLGYIPGADQVVDQANEDTEVGDSVVYAIQTPDGAYLLGWTMLVAGDGSVYFTNIPTNAYIARRASTFDNLPDHQYFAQTTSPSEQLRAEDRLNFEKYSNEDDESASDEEDEESSDGITKRTPHGPVTIPTPNDPTDD